VWGRYAERAAKGNPIRQKQAAAIKTRGQSKCTRSPSLPKLPWSTEV
jgi:hypothetical protein